MKRRDLEKAKRDIITARDKIDREAKNKRRVPFWRHLACLWGWRKPERVWLDRWEKRHEQKLKFVTHRMLAAIKFKDRIQKKISRRAARKTRRV